MFWSVVPPSTYLPIMTLVLFWHPDCLLPLNSATNVSDYKCLRLRHPKGLIMISKYIVTVSKSKDRYSRCRWKTENGRFDDWHQSCSYTYTGKSSSRLGNKPNWHPLFWAQWEGIPPSIVFWWWLQYQLQPHTHIMMCVMVNWSLWITDDVDADWTKK